MLKESVFKMENILELLLRFPMDVDVVINSVLVIVDDETEVVTTSSEKDTF